MDWQGKSNAELWASKVQGASVEKIRRRFNAIALYNDTVATGDNDRLAITLSSFESILDKLVHIYYYRVRFRFTPINANQRLGVVKDGLETRTEVAARQVHH